LYHPFTRGVNKRGAGKPAIRIADTRRSAHSSGMRVATSKAVIHGLHRNHNHRRFTQPGEYAGRAVFRPHHRRDLKDGLFQAIGHTVELVFAAIASDDEPFSGQNLYQERDGELLQHSWVPEEDLEFIDESAAPSTDNKTPKT
jgi:hypothetical protein